MFEFTNYNVLFGLLIIPVFLLIFIINRYIRKKLLIKYADATQHWILLPDSSSFKAWMKFILVLSSIVLLILALAGPRVGSRLREVEKKGREIVVALDVSYSMLASDIKPNRLEMAKNALSRMFEQLENDRVGLIVFAGEAYTVMPLTNDFSAAKLFLKNAGPAMVSKQGTSIPSAINMALRSFSPVMPDGSDPNFSKAIIIITDGENHETGVLESAEEAKKQGITINTIGIGDPDGVPIPLSSGSSDFRRDREGNVIVSKLDENTLKQIANNTGGYYIRSGNDPAGLFRLIRKLDEMEKQEFKTKVFAQYDEKFQYFIGFALLIILIETFTSDKKNKWLSNLNIFR